MQSKILCPCILWLLLLCLMLPAQAQYFYITGPKKRINIPFRLVRNLVIIQLKINDGGPYNFIMDTGAGVMVITDPLLIDSVNIPTKRTIKLTGLRFGR